MPKGTPDTLLGFPEPAPERKRGRTYGSWLMPSPTEAKRHKIEWGGLRAILATRDAYEAGVPADEAGKIGSEARDQPELLQSPSKPSGKLPGQ